MIGETELTQKEIEILTLNASGFDRKQIGELLGCTKYNLAYYFTNIKKKAVRAGLVQNIKGNSVLNSLPLMEHYNILQRAKELGPGYWVEYEHIKENPAPRKKYKRGEHRERPFKNLRLVSNG